MWLMNWNQWIYIVRGIFPWRTDASYTFEFLFFIGLSSFLFWKATHSSFDSAVQKTPRVSASVNLVPSLLVLARRHSCRFAPDGDGGRWLLAWLTTRSWRFQRSRRGTLSARTIQRRNWTPWWWTKQVPRSPQGDWSCISYCSHASGVVWLSSPVTQTTLIRKVLRNNWQWRTSFVSWVWWVNMKDIFQKGNMKRPHSMYLELLEWTEIFVAAPLHTYGPT